MIHYLLDGKRSAAFRNAVITATYFRGPNLLSHSKQMLAKQKWVNDVSNHPSRDRYS